MAEFEAIVALGEPIGGDDGGDSPGVGEEANRCSQGDRVLGLDCDCDRGRKFALAGGRVGVEEAGREDIDPSGITDRGSQGVVELVGVIWEVWHWEGVDGEMGLVRGETKGELRGGPHREGLVESGSNGIEKGRVRSRWGLSVGDNDRDGSSRVDLYGEPTGEVRVLVFR